jgi:transposase
MPTMIWLGLDVHVSGITVAKYVGDASTGTTSVIANDPAAIRRLMRRMQAEGELCVCYEAGPCGYTLHRQLTGLGIRCVVVAPALIPRKPGDRIKTDRRDAEKLARLLRAGALTAVGVPTPAQEDARDLVRARDDARKDRTAARQRLAKFLLRHGCHYRAGRHWTQRHGRWMETQAFAGPAQEAFEHYCAQVRYLDARLGALEHAIAALAGTPAFAPMVARLCGLRGISQLTAMVLLTELFDFRRFRHPRELMAFVGLVPAEYSSGESRRRGRITKTGNAHVRRVLIEAAWAYQHGPRLSARAHQALRGQPPAVAALSHRAAERLAARYRRLTSRGKSRPQAMTAIARELCGFLWALGTTVPEAA